jgi:hypothetical protein
MGKLRDWQQQLTSEPALHETINRLVDNGKLSVDDAASLRASLPVEIQESQYILRHLSAHFAIGLIFAFDLVPLPLGTIVRALWVVGNRVYEMLRGRRDLAAVHSTAVLGVSLIPFAGYFAYLIPLRARSARWAYVFANHITILRKGCTLDDYLSHRPAWFARLVRNVVKAP